MFHGPGVQVVAFVPVAGPVPPPSMVVTPLAQRLGDLLRADEMDVAVDAARREDAALARDDLRRRADGHGDAVLDERISRVADADDAAVLDADVGLDHARHRIEDERVGDDEVERLRRQRERRLAHAVADHLAAAEFHLVAVAAVLRDQVALHLDPEIGVGQAHLVAHGRAEHFRIRAAVIFPAA